MKTLAELKKSQNNILILHYACTDITKSPVTISSISIKDFSARQVLSFSFDEYGNEKNLLSEFIKQIKKYQNHLIVTWNQKDSTYGIQQIQRRCKDLGITKNFPIDLEQISDLDDLFTEKYGRNYVDNPKLRCLAEVNGITLNHFVDGIDEIRLFEEKQYKKIENSTNRKVNVIMDYLSSEFDDRLKISKQPSSKSIDTKEIEKKLREAQEKVMRKMSTNAPGWSYAPGMGPHIAKPTGNETSLPSKPKEVHFIHVPQSTFGKIATICSIVGVPLAIFFGLVAMGIFDNPDVPIDEPQIIESVPSKPIISYEKIWETFEKNRPYTLEWTACSFGTHTSTDDIVSWSFDMTPIMINNDNQTSVIPFHMSYNFRYEGVGESGNFNLRDITSEGSQKFLVDHRDSNSINFLLFSNALEYALDNEIYKIQLIKNKSGFVPYSEDGDDNLLSNYQHQDDDVLVAQFEYDEQNKVWNKIDVSGAICSETRRI